MPKPEDMEEYDGYEIPEPRKVSEKERKEMMKKIEELRKIVKEANNISSE